MIGTIPESVACYSQVRLQNIVSKSLHAQLADTTDLHSIISDLCHFIDAEIAYLAHFPSKSTFLHEFLLFLSAFFTKHLFKRFFPTTFSTNNLLEVFFTWLHLLRFIHNLSEKDPLLDTKALLKTFFEPYKQLIPSIVKNEISNLQKIVYKKINDKEHL